MKNSIMRILAALVFAAPLGSAFAAVPSTMGSNLTAFNNNGGAANNNAWNSLSNRRSEAAAANNAPSADFGNCNALIMRCAQPKCAGCTTMDIAFPIVSGCVQSNPTCAQYGNDLIQYMAAQLVANATAKSAAAESAAAQAAAQQSAQQMQQMQYQMQQMQAEMAAQNAATVAQLQSALDEQKLLTAQAIADATAAAEEAARAVPANVAPVNATTSEIAETGLTAAQAAAVDNGVSAEILVREQITGEIYTAIENAEKAMKDLKITMGTAFEYGGCDATGNNCTGPKRVKRFKTLAMEFFDPYETVLDEMYEALEKAAMVGVDIGDIILMMNDSCSMWGRYICPATDVERDIRYTAQNCKDGRTVTSYIAYKNGKWETVYTNLPASVACTVGAMIPEQYGGCQLVGTIDNKDQMRLDWMNEDIDSNYNTVRIGCISDVLKNSTLFANRGKRQTNIDVETLKRIIEQDAPSVYGSRILRGVRTETTPKDDGIKFCAVSEKSLQDLQKVASLKTLPTSVCVTENQLQKEYEDNGTVTPEKVEAANKKSSGSEYNISVCYDFTDPVCRCKQSGGWLNVLTNVCECNGIGKKRDAVTNTCVDDNSMYNQSWMKNFGRDLVPATSGFLDSGKSKCELYGGTWMTVYCDCGSVGTNLLYNSCKQQNY